MGVVGGFAYLRASIPDPRQRRQRGGKTAGVVEVSLFPQSEITTKLYPRDKLAFSDLQKMLLARALRLGSRRRARMQLLDITNRLA